VKQGFKPQTHIEREEIIITNIDDNDQYLCCSGQLCFHTRMWN